MIRWFKSNDLTPDSRSLIREEFGLNGTNVPAWEEEARAALSSSGDSDNASTTTND